MPVSKDIFAAARAHAVARIKETAVRPQPHAHTYVDGVFPANFYRTLRDHMPATEAYTALAGSDKMAGADYAMRFNFLLDATHRARTTPAIADFWQDMASKLFNEEFVAAMLDRHRPDIEARLEREGMEWPELKTKMILVHDRSSDGVKIHTSAPSNLITFLFYLPEDDRYAAHGTALYHPKDPNMRCWGGPHYDHADFDHVWTAPYRPNSLFMFVKTDQSFHGVEPVHVEGLRRDLLIFYIGR